MEGIKRVQLSEIVELITKGTTPTTLGYEFQDEGVNFLKIECFDENGGFIESKVAYISEECHKKMKRSQLKKGDILFSIAGAIGRVAIVTEGMLPANINQALAIIRISDEQVYLPYIKLILTSPIVVEQFERKKQGVAQLNLSLKDINEISIPLPSKDKQIELAEMFDKVVGVISKRNRELSALDDLIKARFVEMFGHQSHNEKTLPYMTIDDVAEIYLGITHTPTYIDSGVMFISAKNTSGDFLDLSDVKYISREEFEGAPKGSKPQVNDVLFSRVGSNLGHPVILEEKLELCTFVSLGFLRSKGIVTSNYLKHWMRDEFFAKQVSEHVKGGGQPNLNTGWLKEFKIIVPDLEKQKEFDDFCKQVDKSKVAVQKALKETQVLFDSLMQQYFG